MERLMGTVWVVDTETTGLHPREGTTKDGRPIPRDRVCSLAAVEMRDGKPTGRELSWLLDPGKRIGRMAAQVNGFAWRVDPKLVADFGLRKASEMPSDELERHGLSPSDDVWFLEKGTDKGGVFVGSGEWKPLRELKGLPRFADVAKEFLDAVGDAPLAAHNAGFDMAFLNEELVAAGFPPLRNEVVCTRAVMLTQAAGLAVEDFPTLATSTPMPPDLFTAGPHLELAYSKAVRGTRTRLDAAADRYGVDLSERGADGSDHGALPDARICARVFEGMISSGDAARHWDAASAVRDANLARLSDPIRRAVSDAVERSVGAEAAAKAGIDVEALVAEARESPSADPAFLALDRCVEALSTLAASRDPSVAGMAESARASAERAMWRRAELLESGDPTGGPLGLTAEERTLEEVGSSWRSVPGVSSVAVVGNAVEARVEGIDGRSLTVRDDGRTARVPRPDPKAVAAAFAALAARGATRATVTASSVRAALVGVHACLKAGLEPRGDLSPSLVRFVRTVVAAEAACAGVSDPKERASAIAARLRGRPREAVEAGLRLAFPQGVPDIGRTEPRPGAFAKARMASLAARARGVGFGL